MSTEKSPSAEIRGRRFYDILPREDGAADVHLMPFADVSLVVPGVMPWDGMEDDIRARYYAWCESAAHAIHNDQ